MLRIQLLFSMRLSIAKYTGVGTFRILGAKVLNISGGRGGQEGGANSQQAHGVVLRSMRRNDIASTSF